MTRAMYSLLKGDFVTYGQLNIMALPVTIVVVLQLLNLKSKNKRIADVITIVVLALNIVYYIVKLYR